MSRLLIKNRKQILPDNLNNYALTSLGGAGLGTLAANQATEEDENRVRNITTGGVLGALGGAGLYKAKKMSDMIAVPKVSGKPLLRSDDKTVIRGDDGNVHIYYPKRVKNSPSIQNEIHNTELAGKNNLAPELIKENDFGFTQRYGGTTVRDRLDDLTESEIGSIGRNIKLKEKELQALGIDHGDLHIGNVVMPDSNPDNIQFIDLERSTKSTNKPGFKKDIFKESMGRNKHKALVEGYNYSASNKSVVNFMGFTAHNPNYWFNLVKGNNPYTLGRYGLNTVAGMGLGALAGSQIGEEEDSQRNTFIGAGLGALGGLSATNMHYMSKLNNLPKGKVLSPQPAKRVVIRDDGKVTSVYGKSSRDIRREAEALEKLNPTGITPTLRSYDNRSITLDNAGTELTTAIKQGKVTPEQVEQISRNVKTHDQTMQGMGIKHKGLHTDNVFIPDINNPTANTKIIDVEDFDRTDGKYSGNNYFTERPSRKVDQQYRDALMKGIK